MARFPLAVTWTSQPNTGHPDKRWSDDVMAVMWTSQTNIGFPHSGCVDDVVAPRGGGLGEGVVVGRFERHCTAARFAGLKKKSFSLFFFLFSKSLITDFKYV